MAGTSNLIWDNSVNSQYPSDSKPNTVACSKIEFPFNCQKDTETAMRLM